MERSFCDQKTDRRVLKTKTAIRNAFAKLIHEKNINDITIKDIADVAGINRKTFYNHYTGVYQVVNEIEDEILIPFEKALKEMNLPDDLMSPYPIFEKLTLIISQNLDFYGNLFDAKTGKIYSKIIVLLKAKTINALKDKVTIDEKTLDAVISYTVSGVVWAYYNWFVSGCPQSIEEFSEILSTICSNGLNGFLKIK